MSCKLTLVVYSSSSVPNCNRSEHSSMLTPSFSSCFFRRGSSKSLKTEEMKHGRTAYVRTMQFLSILSIIKLDGQLDDVDTS